MSCLGSSHQHTLCRWPQENVGVPQLLLVAPRPEPQQQLSFPVSGVHNEQLDPHRVLLVPGAVVLSLLPGGFFCLTLVDAPQGGISSTGLCPGSFLDVPCSRWRHCRAERENSWEGGIGLDLAGLAVPECDSDKGGGWQVISWDLSISLDCCFSHHLPLLLPSAWSSVGTGRGSGTDPELAGGQGCSAGICWQTKMCQDFCVCQGEQTQLWVLFTP